jgi:protein-S-isoprenylcysteine O-methyltransferase Ste14
VRNPMYVAYCSSSCVRRFCGARGKRLNTRVGVYVIFAGVVLLLEEPLLRSQFGTAYSQYCSEVPRWVPRRLGRAK